MSTDSQASDDGPPKSRNSNFTIKNQNTVNIKVIPPSGPTVTVPPNATYGPSGTIGVHHVVAPGTPDVTYFKVQWNYAMSTENGPLSGNFAVTINMV